MKVELPVAVEKSGRHVAEVERSRTETAHIAHMRQDCRQIVKIIVGIQILVDRKSGGHDRTAQHSIGAGTYGIAIEISAGAYTRMEQLVEIRSIYYPGHYLTFIFKTYAYGKLWKALIEVGRSVKRVDDPTVGRLPCPALARLLGKYGMLRMRPAYIGDQELLRLAVGNGDNVRLPYFDLMSRCPSRK